MSLPKCFIRFLCVLCVLQAAAPAWATHVQSERNLLELDIDTLLEIEIGPSADASAEGLSKPFAGGQVSEGGRMGFLGSSSNLDTPFSITHYTANFLLDRQAASVGDVLQYDPAVRVTRGFGNFQQTYMMRGLPLFSDDMAYNGLYGILPRQYLSAQLIERVDVLLGANAFLNGAAPSSSGLGGAVNVVPKRAPKTALTNVSVGYRSESQAALKADLARRYDDGRWGVRLNGVYDDGDTAVDSEQQSLRLMTVGVDLRADHARLSVDMGFQDHRLHATTPSIDIAPGLAIPDAPDADNALAQPWTYSKEQDQFATLRAEFDFNSQVTGWVAGGYRQGEEDSLFTAFLTVFNPAGDFSANRFDVVHEDHVLTGDTGIRVEFATGPIKHRVSVSSNYFKNESRNAYQIFDPLTGNLQQPQTVQKPETVIFAGGSMSHPLITNRVESSSFGVADQMFMLDDHLQLLFGARRQTIREKNFDYDTGANVSGYHEDAITPSAAVLYRFTHELSVYLHYIEGLVKGDIAPASNSRGAVANAGDALEPYHAEQLEWGVKYQTDTVGTRVALFELRKPTTGYNQNNALVEQGVQEHRGMEWSLYGEPVSGVRWFGGISYLQTAVNHQDSIGAPRWQGNLDLEWDLPTVAGMTVTTQLMTTDSQYADAANQQKVPAWSRLDLGLRKVWRQDDGMSVTVRANLQNVTDESYWASAGGYPGAGYLTLGQPRTFILSSSFSF